MRFLLLLGILLVEGCQSKGATKEFDLIVYGATPSGVAAALSAQDTATRNQDEDFRVAIIEPTKTVGGMCTQGIGLRDFAYEETMGGTMREWGMLNAEYYNSSSPVWQPDMWVGERSFWTMLEKRNIQVFLSRRVVRSGGGVKKSAWETGAGVKTNEIVEIETENVANDLEREWWSAKYFIDSSYEGDLIQASNVSFHVGREAQSKYGESRAGFRNYSLSVFEPAIDPFWDDGTPLKYVHNYKPRKEGSGDDGVMGYSFRLCVTKNVEKAVPFVRPKEYRSEDFELLRRYYKAGGKKIPFILYSYRNYPPKDKLDMCDNEGSPITTDAAGMGARYPTATYQERVKIIEEHKYYVSGLIWFLLSDPSVPDELYSTITSIGLCKDSWPENGHFPAIYVREGIRVVGDRVYTQNDCDRDSRFPDQKPWRLPCHDDSVALGGWWYDIHIIDRGIREGPLGKPMVWNEGQESPGSKRGMPMFELPYFVVVPRESEVSNLLVTVCISVSHVVYAGVREEPTLWQLGQAAGAAVFHAFLLGKSTSSGTFPVAKVPVKYIQSSLLEQGNHYHLPYAASCQEQIQDLYGDELMKEV